MKTPLLLSVLFLGLAAIAVIVAIPFLSQEKPREDDGQTFVTYEPGEHFVVHVPSDAGAIAVRVSVPESPRYAEGAPIVVHTPIFFTPITMEGFEEDFNATQSGFVEISLLLPGQTDRATGSASAGERDHGGTASVAAMRDVLRYALGDATDTDGVTIVERIDGVTPLTDNVGVYAFSHPGVLATMTLGAYADELADVAYLVGRENPVIDTHYPLEQGHFINNVPVVNTAYLYPRDYAPSTIAMDYSQLGWSAADDIPYFDLNGNGRMDERADYVFGAQVPTMFGKHYYSAALTKALRENGALTNATWPDDLATPEETVRDWAMRESMPWYNDLPDGLRVMLVFGAKDHVQSAPDKSHIHMAYDNLVANNIWVRLNPDAAYVNGVAGYTEHAANTEPGDWADAAAWGHPNSAGATRLVSLAAVAEMADRARTATWTDNLDARLR